MKVKWFSNTARRAFLREPEVFKFKLDYGKVRVFHESGQYVGVVEEEK